MYVGCIERWINHVSMYHWRFFFNCLYILLQPKHLPIFFLPTVGESNFSATRHTEARLCWGATQLTHELAESYFSSSADKKCLKRLRWQNCTLPFNTMDWFEAWLTFLTKFVKRLRECTKSLLSCKGYIIEGSLKWV